MRNPEPRTPPKGTGSFDTTQALIAWWAVLGLTTLLVTVPPLMACNIHLSLSLRPLGRAFPWINLVWVVGGVPITMLAVLVATWFRGRPYALPVLLFILGSVLEIGLKHFLSLPHPHAVPEPAQLAVWERRLNLSPHLILALLRGGTVSPHPHLVSRWLPGTFPSGHTFRVVYASGLLFSRRPAIHYTLAALTILAVTATGGHWLADGIGGFLLAMACLAAQNPSRS